MPRVMEEIAAVVHRDETVEAVRWIPRERVQPRTAEQNAPQSPEETIEVLRRVLSKRGQQRTFEQITDVARRCKMLGSLRTSGRWK